jgi:hypothetical protein
VHRAHLKELTGIRKIHNSFTGPIDVGSCKAILNDGKKEVIVEILSNAPFEIHMYLIRNISNKLEH